MPSANDIRKGQVIKYNGEPHLIMETQHRTPGNLRAFVQMKMRNLRYGKSLDQRFASSLAHSAGPFMCPSRQPCPVDQQRGGQADARPSRSDR